MKVLVLLASSTASKNLTQFLTGADGFLPSFLLYLTTEALTGIYYTTMRYRLSTLINTVKSFVYNLLHREPECGRVLYGGAAEEVVSALYARAVAAEMDEEIRKAAVSG